MLKGLGNLANLGNLVKQAQQMGSQLQGISEKLKAERVTGVGGGGLIEVEANGLGEVLGVRIDPSLIERGDREMIEDLLPAAFNSASAEVKRLHGEAMKSVTGGLDLPGIEQILGQVSGGIVPKE